MALGFSLSPAVTVREINLTGNVPNLPSARTGMVLRADTGPALDVQAITNENDLISKFGKPTVHNYQDWFQCWNFLQYASSLFVVRPIDANAETANAGIGLTGTAGATLNEQDNLYNKRVAENTLENFNGVSETLYFFDQNVTSNNRYAVAVVSTPQYWNKPLGLEYYAVVDSVSGTNTVTAIGTPNLTTGSQIILNGDKLAVVTAVTQASSGSATITFDRAVSAVDVYPYFGTAVSASALVSGGTDYVAYFSKTNFTLKEGVVVGAGTMYKIQSIGDEYAVYFKDGDPAIAVGSVYSSTVQYSMTSAYNPNTLDFGIGAGENTLKVQPGFIMEPGVEVDFTEFTLIVASVDKISNTIRFVSPAPSAHAAVTPETFTEVVVSDVIIKGVNYFDRVYDASVIQKTRTVVTTSTGKQVTIQAESLVPFNKVFEYPPNYANDEFGLIVLWKNDDGYYEIADQRIVSYTEGIKDNAGNNIFVEDVMYNSDTIYAKVGSPSSQRVDTSPTILPKITAETSGCIYPAKVEYGKAVYDGFGYTQGDIMQAFSLFADPESFDVNILCNHQLDINYASVIAETRKDCIAVVAPFDYATLTTKSNTDATTYLLDNFGSQTVFDDKLYDAFGTYSAIYGNMKYQYDKFNNVNRWICVAGDVCGLYAQTDNTNDPWWAAAGTTRGVIKNAIKLAFNPNKQNRDDLYVNSINPIMSIPGEGSAIVWGQKTATATPSAFDRVNVRRLLIYLEKTISTACNIGLFEFNDAFTRTRLFNIIDPFLRTVQARRGLYAYNLVIDESNNDSAVIDANGLVVDIYLQPTKVAEFIRLSAIVVPTGANFSEYVGSF